MFDNDHNTLKLCRYIEIKTNFLPVLYECKKGTYQTINMRIFQKQRDRENNPCWCVLGIWYLPSVDAPVITCVVSIQTIGLDTLLGFV
jgi:hypothetical protein